MLTSRRNPRTIHDDDTYDHLRLSSVPKHPCRKSVLMRDIQMHQSRHFPFPTSSSSSLFVDSRVSSDPSRHTASMTFRFWCYFRHSPYFDSTIDPSSIQSSSKCFTRLFDTTRINGIIPFFYKENRYPLFKAVLK